MPRFRLLAIDLDGTLLDSSWNLPEANCQALRAAHRAGVAVAVVTGRRFPAAATPLRSLGLDPLLVLNGGALVKDGLAGPVIDRHLLPVATAKQILAIAREVRADPVVHDGPDGEGHLLIESSDPANRSLLLYLERATPAPRRVGDLAAALHRDPVQIMFTASIKEMETLEQSIATRAGGKVNLARTVYPARDLAILDVLAPGCSKARALRFLAERQGASREETLAIGDNWNDLEMLEAAGLAVVMANAAPELRSRGFALTGSNDECGVAQAIERYVLSL